MAKRVKPSRMVVEPAGAVKLPKPVPSAKRRWGKGTGEFRSPKGSYSATGVRG